ncbi:MAG: efflux RND transporter permease subunit [Candidatus Glassbacteria bacterium]|nr:efflux RND transporter permease subunit [Candidatus Glassbacteria bacterium]
MKLSGHAVRRPIFTTMVTLIVILIGGVAFFRLPIDLMPEITYPTLTVFSEYKNASAEEMEELITRPIEEAVGSVPGVEEVTSISSEGRTRVRVTFTWGVDIDAGANDIRDRLDRIVDQLPEDADRPTLRKFDLASFPVLILGASSNLDPVQMRQIIEDRIKYRIERMPGVAALDIWGGLKREIHVNLYADKVKALGIPVSLILRRLRAENINMPSGTIDRGQYEVTIRTPGHFTDIDQIRNTIIVLRDGASVRLAEIASVEDSWERVTRIVRVNGKNGVRLGVRKQSGTNTVEVARGVLEEIERLNEEIPQIKITPIIDTSEYITKSISNVGSMAMYGGILAIIVLLFFLRSFRSTIVIATAIPVSIIATFALIYFGGFTLNIMTIGGLALGIGLLVDNSIVVLENIYRLRESGMSRVEAAVEGSAEVTAAIIASTLTTLAVFLPLVFVRGMSGVMFKQLSLVVSFSLLCSLAVAVTIVPMLSAKILGMYSRDEQKSTGWFDRFASFSSGVLAELESKYKTLLHYALNHRLMVILVTAGALAVSFALVPLIGVEFMPKADEGEVRVDAEMDVGIRVEVMDEKFEEVERIVRENVPELKNVVTSIGGSGYRVEGSHTGRMRVALVSQFERSRSSEEIAAVLREKLANIPGVTIRTREGQGLFLFRIISGGTERVQVEIRGHDLEISNELTLRVKKIIEGVRGVTDAQISRELGVPEELVIVDRQKAADMKLSVSQIANTLQTVLSGSSAGYFHEGGDEFRILVRMQNAESMELGEVLDLTLTNSDGRQVVLRNVVSVRPRTGPVLIERKDQERIALISANISGRDMGSIIDDIRERLESVPVPRDFSIVFAGDYEEQQKAFKELMLSFILALILVYMVMACQYESLRDPFVVMFSVPMAAVGVILMLFLTGTTFNVQSFIGCIMLGGIVVNNAILLVDHTNLLRRRDGLGLVEAIEEAGRRRLRPILMTAATTILGLTPLAFGIGEGAETQVPLARAVIGGLISSTLITLVLVPVVYSIFEKKAPGQ